MSLRSIISVIASQPAASRTATSASSCTTTSTGSTVKGDIEHSEISIETGANFNGKVIRISKQQKKSSESEGEETNSIYSLTDKAVAK